MAYGIQTPLDLARLITQMSFGGLSEVADALVQMNSQGERDVKTVTGMASTLWDWAEAVVEEDEAEARERARIQKAAEAQKAA